MSSSEAERGNVSYVYNACNSCISVETRGAPNRDAMRGHYATTGNGRAPPPRYAARRMGTAKAVCLETKVLTRAAAQRGAALETVDLVKLVRFSLLAAPLVAALTLGSTTSRAASNDARAQALARQALLKHYLNLEFEAAEGKLRQAIELCTRDCSNAVRARIFVDLGVVYIAGLKKREDGLASFLEALSLDPSVELDPDLTTDEVRQAFEEAKRGGEVMPSAGAQASEQVLDIDAVDPAEAAAATGQLPTGIIHAPPPEQTVHTPLPLFVKVAWKGVAGVDAYVKSFGAPKYQPVRLEPYQGGWAGEAPCSVVGTVAGQLSYYFVASDREGEPLGTVGSPESPFVVDMKPQLDGPPPHLPGQRPPEPCPAPPEDCPPDFPGCAPLGEGWPEEEPTASKPTHRRFWVNLSLAADALLMPAADAACAGDDYECFYEGDVYRDPSLPVGLEEGGARRGAGDVNGGLALATMRVLAGVDYALTPHWLLGVNLGFAFRGGPQRAGGQVEGAAFFPLHAELGASYWFRDGLNLQRGALVPFASLSAGLAQVDASLEVPIVDQSAAALEDCAGQGGECLVKNVEAWRKTGTLFAALGGGALYAIDERGGVVADLRLMQLFPSPGTGFALRLGYRYGF